MSFPRWLASWNSLSLQCYIYSPLFILPITHRFSSHGLVVLGFPCFQFDKEVSGMFRSKDVFLRVMIMIMMMMLLLMLLLLFDSKCISLIVCVWNYLRYFQDDEDNTLLHRELEQLQITFPVFEKVSLYYLLYLVHHVAMCWHVLNMKLFHAFLRC